MSSNTTQQMTRIDRAQRVLAKARRRQLDMAMQGRVSDSARYAARAERVRVHVSPVNNPMHKRRSA